MINELFNKDISFFDEIYNNIHNIIMGGNVLIINSIKIN